MYTSSNTWCVFLLSFLFSKGALLLSCGISKFTENLIAEEFSFRNITYTVNITGSSFIADYKVCEEDVMKTVCYFVKDIKDVSFSSMFGKDLSLKTGVTCYWEQRHVSSSVVALDIYISQVVTRSLSAMILSTGTSSIPKPTLLTHVEVLYPPNITTLTVEGQEVHGSYIINNKQEVNVSCYFKKGNPSAVFRLLVKNRTELISSHDEEHLHHLLTAQCKDDWPMVRCEGNGTQQNKSVKFLVRCPPQFVDVSTQIYTTSAHHTIELPVKAHTTLLTACFLTAVSSQNITKRNIRCTLHGKPPDLKLHLHLDTEAITQGNWTLTLRNEIGSATATLSVLGSLTFTASSPKAALPTNVTTALVCGFAVTVVVIVVVSIIAVRNAKRQRNDRETYVAEFTNAAETSPHPDREKKPSCNRNADGLIYGDLIFTNTKLSKVIIGTEEKTEYTEIQVTSPRLQTDCRQQEN